MKQARVLSQTEYARMLAVVSNRRYSTRNQTIVALSFMAGLRACEIANLRVGDVYDAGGAVRDTVYLSQAQTKGVASATVLVNKRLSRQLVAYAKAYPHHVSQPSAPLIFSGKGGGFTAQTIVNWFQRYYRISGINGASSHSGRRSFVTALAEAGINARVVQTLARHKHLSTTQRYIDVNDIKLRAAVELVG